MAKKLTSGDGWSFEPSRPPAEKRPESLPDDRQMAAVRLEKRPRGKEATVVSGFVLSDADRKTLATTLRKGCGAGGSDTPAAIEIQGDHREKITAILAAKGWRLR